MNSNRDAVLVANGIGNFVMMTPFLQSIDDPTIFIPREDHRREAIESISTFPVEVFEDMNQLISYKRVFRIWCAPRVTTSNMIIQEKPPLHEWPEGLHESDFYMKMIGKSKIEHEPLIRCEDGWKLHHAVGQNIIAIGNGSTFKWDKKKWPEDRWVELISALIKKKYVVAYFGNKDEAVFGKMLSNKFSTKFWNFAGMLNLSSSVDTIKNCSVFVTTDSGLMHCAGAAGVSIIALWPATSWDKNKPLSKGKVVKIASDPKVCSLYPCYGRPEMWDCKRSICMESITVPMVLDTIEKIVG